MIPIANPRIGPWEVERVCEVLEEGRLAAGEEVRGFERKFAAEVETDHAVATSNGTTALHTALEAVGIGPGDRVLTTPFSFVATANAVRLCGAEPVFADIDPRTYNLDPDAAAAVMDDEPIDAILVVHLYGLPAAMDRFQELAAVHDVPLVEDAAQAHGATYDGQPVGSLGDAATFSFYPTKNVTTGEGGIVVTDDDEVARRARQFIDHGRSADDGDRFLRTGHNFRMTNLAAAIGLEQVERLAGFVSERRTNAGLLSKLLADTDLVLPVDPEERTHAYNQYTVRSEDRDALAARLADEGVGTKVYYPRPIHQQPAYEGVTVDCPEAERAAQEVLSLPAHPGVTNWDIQTIADAVRAHESERVQA